MGSCIYGGPYATSPTNDRHIKRIWETMTMTRNEEQNRNENPKNVSRAAPFIVVAVACDHGTMGYKFSLAHYLMRRLYIWFFFVSSSVSRLVCSWAIRFGQVSQVQFWHRFTRTGWVHRTFVARGDRKLVVLISRLGFRSYSDFLKMFVVHFGDFLKITHFGEEWR